MRKIQIFKPYKYLLCYALSFWIILVCAREVLRLHLGPYKITIIIIVLPLSKHKKSFFSFLHHQII